MKLNRDVDFISKESHKTRMKNDRNEWNKQNIFTPTQLNWLQKHTYFFFLSPKTNVMRVMNMRLLLVPQKKKWNANVIRIKCREKKKAAAAAAKSSQQCKIRLVRRSCCVASLFIMFTYLFRALSISYVIHIRIQG